MSQVADAVAEKKYPVEIVPVEMQKHPNADTLSVVQVYGYTCVVRTEDWQGVKRAAYIPPDSMVKVALPEFNFLLKDAKADGKARIRAKKLRGVVSFGLLVPVADDAELGADYAERLQVEHYEPEIHGGGGQKGVFVKGEVAPGPNLTAPKYDLENFRRYSRLLNDCEMVQITEKVDGTNSRYVYYDGQMYCGSRLTWKREYPDWSYITMEFLLNAGQTPENAAITLEKLNDKKAPQSLWWQILRETPELEQFCRDNPGVVVYGEVAGTTNCIKYCESNHFAAFDILKDGKWMHCKEAREFGSTLPWVPLLAETEYSFDKVCDLAEGSSVWDKVTRSVIKEGCVVVPLEERYDHRLGRVKLKCVSGSYLEKFK